ncbi:hypothetical protein VPNG_04988 [Cytospora leucostoma]|uniref:C2H2-type domain-containing protein n=1 Tax=Cytospora leucostoma TaxID=1230097 RepID=A0A423X7H5_9PEZI|nr:hypothetical protein VPNG_04988 [Cytospora leucostoma]
MDHIQRASEDELRAIVLALCKDSRTERRVLAYLGKLRKLKHAQASSGTKRKATEEVFICVRCNEAFSEDTNHRKACTYHDGYLEIDEEDINDVWADWDERCHGTMDTDENREKYPNGFAWDCCDKEGTAPGCTKGHHYAVEGKKMKPTTKAVKVADASRQGEGSETGGGSGDNDPADK